MSTDPTSAVPPTADPAARAASRRFRRTLAALLTGLIVLCLALVAVNLLNGPRLTGSDVDTSAVVTAANQRLVLETNQQLTEVSADQVTVSPAGAVDVQTRNDSIVIVFPQPLAYDTDDWVQVTGTFVSNPSARSSDTLAVLPTSIEPVDQPSDPYVY